MRLEKVSPLCELLAKPITDSDLSKGVEEEHRFADPAPVCLRYQSHPWDLLRISSSGHPECAWQLGARSHLASHQEIKAAHSNGKRVGSPQEK